MAFTKAANRRRNAPGDALRAIPAPPPNHNRPRLHPRPPPPHPQPVAEKDIDTECSGSCRYSLRLLAEPSTAWVTSCRLFAFVILLSIVLF